MHTRELPWLPLDGGGGKVEKFRENNKAFSTTLLRRARGRRESPADILCKSCVLSLAVIVCRECSSLKTTEVVAEDFRRSHVNSLVTMQLPT